MKPRPLSATSVRKTVFFVFVLTTTIISGPIAYGTTNTTPNLIIILTDSQGYHDVGFNGCKDIPTPNLDSIASNGVRFTSAYVTSTLGSPSRAGLLTGRYPERFGYETNPDWQPNNSKAGLPPAENTLADMLAKAGYRTGMVGKWHLGSNPATAHPLKHGFDEFFGFLGAGHNYLPEGITYDENQKVQSEYDSWRLPIIHNYTAVKITNYLTDEFSDAAVRFIHENQGQPFFLLVAYNAAQPPMEAPEKYLGRFSKILGLKRQSYAAMISAVDDGVGKVLLALREHDLETNTLVVYLSATSGALEANSSDNYPLRGFRNNLYEGSWRVPLAMQWPGHLPKGKVYDQPVVSLDIFATMAALADVPPDPQHPLDGVNLLPYLMSDTNTPPHDAIYARMTDRSWLAVRSGDYKLIVTSAGQNAELYDVTKDIGELKNIADEKPQIVKELSNKLMVWNNQMKSSGSAPAIQSPPAKPIDSESDDSKIDP